MTEKASTEARGSAWPRPEKAEVREMGNEYTLGDLLEADLTPAPADPDDVMVTAMLGDDGRYHTLDGVVAQLTTRRAESSYGQPVLVIGGRAYGPGDVTPYGPASRLVLLPRTNRTLCERWSALCQSLCGESATARAMEEAKADLRDQGYPV